MTRPSEIPLRLLIYGLIAPLMVGALGACGKKSSDAEHEPSTSEVARATTPGGAERVSTDAGKVSEPSERPVPQTTTPGAGEVGRTEPRVPDFSVQDLDGKVVRMADFRGQVVLIDFWATWCGPCRVSIPHLIELYNEYSSKGFTVLGISLDQRGPAVVRPFVATNKIPYPVVMGDQATVQRFGSVRAIPTAFLVDAEGYIVGRYEGLRDKRFFEKEIEKALAGAPAS